MRKFASIIWLPVVFLVLTNCGVESSIKTDATPEAGFSFWLTSKDHVFHCSGEQFVITYSMKPKDIPIEWSSTDQLVAIVDENGVVTAIGPGDCDIWVTVGTKEENAQTLTSKFNVHCNFS